MLKQGNDDFLHIKLGKTCVSGLVTSGYAFMVLSVFPILTLEISGYIGGAALFLAGAFFVLTSSGNIIDCKNKRMNSYCAYFGIFKINSWIDIKGYNYLTVFMVNKNNIIYSRSNRANVQSSKNYEVFLIDNSKENRQMVASFHHAKHAVDFAKELAIKMHIKYIAYHPENGWE